MADRPAMRSLVLCILGMVVGLAFCPATAPPYNPGDELRYMAVGAFLAWTVGTAVGHARLRKSSGAVTDSENNRYNDHKR